MNFKLTAKERIPLVLYCNNEWIISGLQTSTMRKDGSFRGYYMEYSYVTYLGQAEEIGNHILKKLKQYIDVGDITQEQVFLQAGMSREEHNSLAEKKELEFAGVKTLEELHMKYRLCSIRYSITDNKYRFQLSILYRRGKDYNFEVYPSTGKPGLLTFDTPLEFDSSITPEELGRMTLEAFDRCQQLRDAANGNKFPKKQLELLDESVLVVQMPRDKHFADSDDMGVGELYQVYEYFPKEDSDDSQAHFFLGIGAELNCDLSKENILAAWENYDGKAEYFEVQEVSHGIYSLRAELRNKNIHKISYFMQQNESLILECSMELSQPGRRKKLEEKLVPLFEEFATGCKMK